MSEQLKVSADVKRSWPEEGESRIPYWVYTDEDVYQSELERIWYGDHWSYAGAECEIPTVGSYRTTTIGERSVILVRSAENEISVLENRCAHRGVKICQMKSGKVDNITCPYHQWSYALDGKLQGVPFRRGIKGIGGMPADFSLSDHGLVRLKVEVCNGLIWASFGNPPPFREYIGEKLWWSIERIFSGERPLRIVGYNRQFIAANWKLIIENIRDNYHGTLLHVFLPTFGLITPNLAAELRMDETGRHGSFMAVHADGGGSNNVGQDVLSQTKIDSTWQLADRRLIETVHELKGKETAGSCAVFPSVILLQQINALQLRYIVPKGPHGFDLVWTHFGFEDDDDEMRERRVRHGNLFGPGGLVSVDDSEVLAMVQSGYKMEEENGEVVVEMGSGGRESNEESNMATETGIRGMYQYYREVMGL